MLKVAVFWRLKRLGAKRILLESSGIYTFQSDDIIPEETLKSSFPSATFRIFYTATTSNGKTANYYEMFI